MSAWNWIETKDGNLRKSRLQSSKLAPNLANHPSATLLPSRRMWDIVISLSRCIPCCISFTRPKWGWVVAHPCWIRRTARRESLSILILEKPLACSSWVPAKIAWSSASNTVVLSNREAKPRMKVPWEFLIIPPIAALSPCSKIVASQFSFHQPVLGAIHLACRSEPTALPTLLNYCAMTEDNWMVSASLLIR